MQASLSVIYLRGVETGMRDRLADSNTVLARVT